MIFKELGLEIEVLGKDMRVILFKDNTVMVYNQG